eukprot:49284-Eustigmatos_ZCMA.PRE.1
MLLRGSIPWTVACAHTSVAISEKHESCYEVGIDNGYLRNGEDAVHGAMLHLCKVFPMINTLNEEHAHGRGEITRSITLSQEGGSREHSSQLHAEVVTSKSNAKQTVSLR